MISIYLSVLFIFLDFDPQVFGVDEVAGSNPVSPTIPSNKINPLELITASDSDAVVAFL